MREEISSARPLTRYRATPPPEKNATIPWKSLGIAAAAALTAALIVRRKNVSFMGPIALAVGGAIVTRRLRNTQPATEKKALVVSLTIARPIDEAMAFWQKLPIASPDATRGLRLFRTGECRVIRDGSSSEVAWEIEGAGAHRGRCRFEKALVPDSTVIRVTVLDVETSHPLRSTVKNLLFGDEAQLLREEFKRIKQVLETGEAATIEGQSVGQCKGGNR